MELILHYQPLLGKHQKLFEVQLHILREKYFLKHYQPTLFPFGTLLPHQKICRK
ncbi:MAG TPA: hypothetical protein [Caudoviricetes sp.]|nr:MAG TPA: hypothetical protein [Caudoviricetes sp.]